MYNNKTATNRNFLWVRWQKSMLDFFTSYHLARRNVVCIVPHTQARFFDAKIVAYILYIRTQHLSQTGGRVDVGTHTLGRRGAAQIRRFIRICS
jgi:hypothetical protein